MGGGVIRMVKAEPYDWPYDGRIVPEKSALLLVDLQNALFSQLTFLRWAGRSGPPPMEVIARLRELVALFREIGGFTILHTREGHRPDLSDCPRNQLWRSRGLGGVLVRGEPGWEIVAPLAPRPMEIVIDKPGKSAFWATDLDLILRNRKITHLILAGLFADGAVHSTMREANDRGYECLLLEDCTAAIDDENYRSALKSIKMSGGIFGAVAPSPNLIEAIPRGKELNPSFVRRGEGEGAGPAEARDVASTPPRLPLQRGGDRMTGGGRNGGNGSGGSV